MLQTRVVLLTQHTVFIKYSQFGVDTVPKTLPVKARLKFTAHKRSSWDTSIRGFHNRGPNFSIQQELSAFKEVYKNNKNILTKKTFHDSISSSHCSMKATAGVN